MRKRSGQVHSRESSATLQLTVSLLYLLCTHKVAKRFGKCYNDDTAVVLAALQKNAGLRRWRDISPEKRGTL